MTICIPQPVCGSKHRRHHRRRHHEGSWGHCGGKDWGRDGHEWGKDRDDCGW